MEIVVPWWPLDHHVYMCDNEFYLSRVLINFYHYSDSFNFEP